MFSMKFMSGTKKWKYDLKTAKRVINRNCLWGFSEVGFSVKSWQNFYYKYFQKIGIDYV